ncbi:hypothetical protein [Pseudomonas sp. BNK-43-a]|uniref:hypothetical protein n=1 Tax=unclassified Pseudomonas TaxID=196821 RepID=UPI0039BF72CC
MESYLYQWVIDLSVLCSIGGLVWTAVVWWETRKIRKEFLIRIRLPDLVKELRVEVKSLLAAVTEWQSGGDHSKTSSAIASLKGILLSLRLKISSEDLKQVEVVIALIEGREIFHSDPESDPSKQHAWKLSNEANTLVSLLGQREKDIRWA